MRLLLISSSDSFNHELEAIWREAVKRGHDVDLVVTTSGQDHAFRVRNFRSKVSIKTAVAQINTYDAFFFGNIGNPWLRDMIWRARGLKASIYSHIISPTYVLGGDFVWSDLTFVLGQYAKDVLKANGVMQELRVVGSPQFDVDNRDIVSNSLVTREDTTRPLIVFLEQHFFPAGDRAKKQLATLLVEIAEKNPEYDLVVKPRTLPDSNNAKHKSVHIYEFFRRVNKQGNPNNLYLLKKHVDLFDLISQSEIVITTFSSAILAAVALNKKIALISGFDSLDIRFYNSKVIEEMYEPFRSFGKVIDLTLIAQSIKNIKKLKKTERDYILKTGKSSELILDILEKEYPHKGDSFVERDRERTYNLLIDEFYRFFLCSGLLFPEYFKNFKHYCHNCIFSETLHPDLLAKSQIDALLHKTVKKYFELVNESGSLSRAFAVEVAVFFMMRSTDDLSKIFKGVELSEIKFCIALASIVRKQKFHISSLRYMEDCLGKVCEDKYPFTLFSTDSGQIFAFQIIVRGYIQKRAFVGLAMCFYRFPLLARVLLLKLIKKVT